MKNKKRSRQSQCILQPNTHTHIYIYIHTNTHAHTHTQIHTHTHTCMLHARTHTHTHTLTRGHRSLMEPSCISFMASAYSSEHLYASLATIDSFMRSEKMRNIPISPKLFFCINLQCKNNDILQHSNIKYTYSDPVC